MAERKACAFGLTVATRPFCAASRRFSLDAVGAQVLQYLFPRLIAAQQIGKESNSLENVESGLEHDEKNVYTEYVDLKRDEWAAKMFPALKRIPLKVLVERCRGKLSRSALIDLRAGRSWPHRKTRELLMRVLRKLGLL